MGNEPGKIYRCSSCYSVHSGPCPYKKKPDVTCYRCNNKGHIARDCSFTLVNKECEHCGGKHVSSNCHQHIKSLVLAEKKNKEELEKKMEMMQRQIKSMQMSEQELKKRISEGTARENFDKDRLKKEVEVLQQQIKKMQVKEQDLKKNDQEAINNMNKESVPSTSPKVVSELLGASSSSLQSENNLGKLQNTSNPFTYPNIPNFNCFPPNSAQPSLNPIPPQVPPHNYPGNMYNQQNRPPFFPQSNQLPPNNNQPYPFQNPPPQMYCSPQNIPSNQKYSNQFNRPNPPNEQNFQNPPQQNEERYRQNINRYQGNNNQHQRGRGNFNRNDGRGGRGGRGYQNNNYNNNGNFRGRGNYHDRNKGRGSNNAPPLFSNGNPKTSKSDDNEENDSNVERKQRSKSEIRPKKDHQGVYRGGIHKERVFSRTKNNFSKQDENKKVTESSDSDSTTAGYETAETSVGPKKKNKQNKKKKDKNLPLDKSSTNLSKDNENEASDSIPLSKNNLGKGNVLMKYIGSNIPTFADAVFDDVSLYQRVEGVMLMSDPNSNEPIMKPATNLLEIIEFKSSYSNAKSFFC